MTEIITAVLIHLVIPAIGLFLYIALCKKIKREQIPNPPFVDFFIIFSTYGGLLLVVLTYWYWKWSGAASLGVLYLFLGAPFVMGFIAYTKHSVRKLSEHHNIAYMSALAYFIIAPMVFVALIITEVIQKTI